MAFLFKDKKSGSWYVDYTLPTGKRIRKRVGRSKQAAQLALKEIDYQLSFDRAGVATPDVTLEEFFERYEKTIKAKIRPKTWIRYRVIMDHFRAYLGRNWRKVKLQQLGREMFERYIAWRRDGESAFSEKKGNRGRPPKTKTVNTELDMLASMFNKAVEWRYLSTNPAKSIPRLKEDDRKPFRFFSLEEIEIMRQVADQLDRGVPLPEIESRVEDFYLDHPELEQVVSSQGKAGTAPWLRNGRTILEFLLATGSREDEILALEWSWLDLKRGTVSYRRRANWVPKGSEREIALREDLVKRLQRIARAKGQPRVFLDWNDHPIPPRTFERGVRNLIQLTLVPLATLHDFRHTFASHLAMAGIPLPTIQQLLGHRDIQTVMIYAHLSPSHVHQSVNALPF